MQMNEKITEQFVVNKVIEFVLNKENVNLFKSLNLSK